ncbi:MAG TPA: hypothetical protein VNC15_06115 [Solirubrobacterales bacterium]|jgi:hypothetical protein|nr:hypothetical protein [Solirubrobacterales bacterium]
MRSERGQGTVEWVGLVTLVSLLLLGLVAAGVRVPGAALAGSLADRILCAATVADSCGDEPALIAVYGSEVGELVRRHMPNLVFEAGSRALPVDFRRCRSSECGDAEGEEVVGRTDEGLPVTVFVHVVDCREEEARPADADCSGDRDGNLYVQYWTYYADSATLRGVPIAGPKGYHHDDWEGVQLRFGPDGEVDERASSHHGYNYFQTDVNWISDAGIASHEGWGPESGLLFVSGGSHAGNVMAAPETHRFTPGRRVHLVPLEPIAASSSPRFAISPPWMKQVWVDPEARGTS